MVEEFNVAQPVREGFTGEMVTRLRSEGQVGVSEAKRWRQHSRQRIVCATGEVWCLWEIEKRL